MTVRSHTFDFCDAMSYINSCRLTFHVFFWSAEVAELVDALS